MNYLARVTVREKFKVLNKKFKARNMKSNASNKVLDAENRAELKIFDTFIFMGKEYC